MRLSDIKGERVFDVIADIIEPIAIIAEDKEAASLFKREKCPDGMTAAEFAIKKIRKSMPKLMRDHKNEVCTVFAAMKGVTTEQYIESITMVTLLKDVMELISDPEFTAFFS